MYYNLFYPACLPVYTFIALVFDVHYTQCIAVVWCILHTVSALPWYLYPLVGSNGWYLYPLVGSSSVVYVLSSCFYFVQWFLLSHTIRAAHHKNEYQGIMSILNYVVYATLAS